ncbi:MAG: DUF1501 domain-containing protein [Planctomycetaceae bacterium]
MFNLQVGKSRGRYCDRVTRRQMLRVGSTGLFAGLTLPRLLELQAVAGSPAAAKANACIVLFLEGGPSTIDMWDMKPQAPREIRGPYEPIATAVPGTMVCQHLPHCARVADKFTILRNHSHTDNGHTTGYHYCMTGYRAGFPDGENPVPNNTLYPSIGSIISRELGARGSVPPYVNLPDPMAAGGPGFYGAEHAPFVIESDPVQPDFEVKDIELVKGVSRERMTNRQRLLAGIESRQRPAPGRAAAMTKYYEKAQDLVTSTAAKKAFDIGSEPQKLREAYGYTSLGQSALLARRLVEAGCRFVGIDHGSWDTHFTCFPSLENDLIPHADRAFSALVTDLQERGLLDSTLVVMMGEMGRTPRINNEAGRDHWSMAQSVVFAGGGIKPGLVIGATDQHAAAPISDPVSVEDILKTLLTQMGIDTEKTYYTPLGRPVPIVNGGKMIAGLV